MRRVRLAFSDFIFSNNARDRMSGFNPHDNVFTRLLKSHYALEIVPMEEAEVLIYSTFGEAHQRFMGKKIFYTSENVLPDFNECDFAVSFSYSDDPRHYRLPQYVFYVEDPQQLVKGADYRPEQVLQTKEHFCNFVVSNPRCPERNRFFRLLNQRRRVDSAGRHFNNIGSVIKDKVSFIKKYKFTLAFENSSTSGYTTEKLVEPMLAGSIPIYWGNPDVGRDFNPKSFINVSDFINFEAAIDYILKVDAEPERYLAYLKEPWLNQNQVPSWFDKKNQLAAWMNFIDAPWEKRRRIYQRRGLRDHVRGTGLARHLSSLGCKLDGLAWKFGWR